MDLKLTPYKVLATSTKHGKPASAFPLNVGRLSDFGVCSIFHRLTSGPVIPSGFMQFVQSVPVAEVLATEGNIQVSITRRVTQHVVALADSSLFLQSFFRKHAPSEKGPYGISSEVMDTYVKSCGELLFPSSSVDPSTLNEWWNARVPPFSRLLCHHLHPRSGRQTSGQPAADKDRCEGPGFVSWGSTPEPGFSV